ncbi:MAG: TonB-dependent receptor, partial [Bacteroidales bacterium]|nr:TonB-dependent receptor [Bacteroidales bacterium]
MRHLTAYIGMILLLGMTGFTTAQAQKTYTISGIVTDAANKETLPQAHIMIDGKSGVGAVTDFDGRYTLTVSQPEVTLIYHYVGYDVQRQQVSFKPGETQKEISVALRMKATELRAVKVVGTRYTADAKTSIQTLEVVGIKELEKKNATTLDKALSNVAGLAIVDNEPQMRGGSGFSSGMGSRVGMLLDEMPILRADAGRPTWNLIPMEDVAQVEVLKGASSVLFGSAAINGAINVRTAYAKADPETKAKLHIGAYSKPKQKDLAPWTKNLPLVYGASLSHARRIGKKFDLTLAAEFENNDGYRGPGSAPSTGPDKKNELVRQEMRVRANTGMQYRINEQWTVALNGNFMYSDNEMYNFWYNADEGIYYSYPGSLTHFKDYIFFIDPHVKYVHPNGGTHTFDSRVFYSDNHAIDMPADVLGQDAFSRSVYNAYQYKKTFKKAGDLSLATGATNQFTYSFGEVFSGSLENFGEGHHTGDNFALFALLSKKFFDESLGIELGGRWELCMVDEWMENSPVFQLGLNYELKKSHTFFRGSIGQGYRAATIGEKFIITKVGMFGFYPNHDLKSERSLNMELGVRQMFRIGAIQGFLDVAGFHQIYNNYIEFFFGPWNRNANTLEQYGFRYFNTGKATISGVEASLTFEAELADFVNLQTMLNYTYSLPVCRDRDFVYATTNPGTPYEYNYTYENSASDPSHGILKYRIQHMAKLDVNLNFLKRFTIGAGLQYMSAMQIVDKLFLKLDSRYEDHAPWLDYFDEPLPFNGMVDFMERHKNGSLILDLRASVELGSFTIAVMMSNVLNSTYALRPLCVEPPRLTKVQVM